MTLTEHPKHSIETTDACLQCDGQLEGPARSPKWCAECCGAMHWATGGMGVSVGHQEIGPGGAVCAPTLGGCGLPAQTVDQDAPFFGCRKHGLEHLAMLAPAEWLARYVDLAGDVKTTKDQQAFERVLETIRGQT